MTGDLLSTWVAQLEEAGETRASALRRMNAACGTSITLRRLWEWRSPNVVRFPPPVVLRWLVTEVVAGELLRLGFRVSREQEQELAARLTVDP